MPPPLARQQVHDDLRATFPTIHWGLSEEGGWSEGYLIHVEPEDDDLDDTDRILTADDEPSAELIALLKRVGWNIHTYDSEGRLYFLAAADDEQVSLEAE